MDAVTYVKEHKRICDSHSCENCPLHEFVDCEHGDPEELVDAVEEWSKENPLVTNGEVVIDMMEKMDAPYIRCRKNKVGQVEMILDASWWDAEYNGGSDENNN